MSMLFCLLPVGLVCWSVLLCIVCGNVAQVIQEVMAKPTKAVKIRRWNGKSSVLKVKPKYCTMACANLASCGRNLANAFWDGDHDLCAYYMVLLFNIVSPVKRLVLNKDLKRWRGHTWPVHAKKDNILTEMEDESWGPDWGPHWGPVLD